MKMRVRGKDPFEKGSSPPNPHSLKLLKIGLIGVAETPLSKEGTFSLFVVASRL